jgi:hypothetical protein
MRPGTARSSTRTNEGSVRAPEDVFARVAIAWQKAGSARPLLAGPEPILVAPTTSGVLVAGRASGVFSPYTGESHVVRGLPPVSRAFVACHEVAHRRGFAREDEANGLAFLVGVESGDPYISYSARAAALAYVLRALRWADPAAFDTVAAELDPALVRDLVDEREYWTRERGALVRAFGRVATATNDAYLSSMGAADGVASYGRMVDLVLAWDAWRSGAAAPGRDRGPASPGPGKHD